MDVICMQTVKSEYSDCAYNYSCNVSENEYPHAVWQSRGWWSSPSTACTSDPLVSSTCEPPSWWIGAMEHQHQQQQQPNNVNVNTLADVAGHHTLLGTYPNMGPMGQSQHTYHTSPPNMLPNTVGMPIISSALGGPYSTDGDSCDSPPLHLLDKSPSPPGLKLEPASPATSTGSSSTEPAPSGISSTSGSSSGPGRRAKPKEDKFCGVCGDRALGFNFDAISCESCKAFFRRNASKGLETFKCAYDNNCLMNVNNRRFCKRCRLAKCLEIGMKKEYILTEEEKAEKKRKIDQNKIVRTLETRGWLPKDIATSELEERELLTEQDIALIDEVHSAYERSLEVHLGTRRGQRFQPGMDDLMNWSELSVRRVIDMAKRVEDFRVLNQEDQISLLKGGSVELLILRGVLCYDGEQGRFLETCAGDSEETDSMTGMAFIQGAGDTGANFMKLWNSLIIELQCDKTAVLLLLVICLFSSDRSHVPPESKSHIEEVQLKYCLLLEKYIKTRSRNIKEARRTYPLVLNKLSDLRSMNEEFSKRMVTVNPGFIQPLMNELFDLPSIAASYAASTGAADPSTDPSADLDVDKMALNMEMGMPLCDEAALCENVMDNMDIA